jgi:phosphatidylglycerol---prolipoprotein diacylglyceryl transferase
MNAWTPALLGIAMLAGWWLARGRQTKLALSESDRIAINLSALCGALLGARMPFWLEQGFTAGNWLWWADGKTILGGILGAYVAVEIVKESRGIKTLTGDSFALPAAVMIGIGRLACFCSGCCYGQPTSLPWGVVFPSAADPQPTMRHPTQIYEALFHFLAAILLILAERSQWLKGQRLKAFLIAYMVYRFLTEFIRPEPSLLLTLTAYQWTSLGLILALCFQWYWHSKRITAGALKT